MKKYSLFAALLLLLCCSCKNREVVEPEVYAPQVSSKYSCTPVVSDTLWYTSGKKAPLFEGLEGMDFSITTTSPDAQKYFDQGLMLAYGFNHAEAARSFYYATRLDPECAMCYWGYAYVLGPNYNMGMEPGNYPRAYEAVQKALELSENATEKEKGLIEALSERYLQEAVEDRVPLDQAYSSAMKELSLKYPEDADINALYAESLLDLHPWDLHDKQGDPKEWTPEILTTLENLMRKFPKHPGAHHFYIHAVEASSSPHRALASAKLFDEGLVPGAGHLIHMPAHVYIRTGDYHKGTMANLRAVKSDSSYVTLCHAQGAYPLALYPHNYHFMAATATLEGNSQYSLLGAKKLSEMIHPDLMKQPGWGALQHYYVTPLYVMVKLGDWDGILNSELETYDLQYPEAVKHYARGMAYLGKQNPEAARRELQELERISTDESLQDISIWEINTVAPLVQIARLVLEAEILASEKNYDQSINLLKEAVVLEDGLNYTEPPDWFFSVRHHLGAVQNEAGRYNEAIATFKDDLRIFPKNGWAQHGLKLAYEKTGDQENLAKTKAMIEDSWEYADITIDNSRIK